MKEVQAQCLTKQELYDFDDLTLSAEEFDFDIKEKLKCFVDAIGEVVKGTDLEGVWAETVKDMEKILKEMKNCAEYKNKVEAMK